MARGQHSKMLKAPQLPLQGLAPFVIRLHSWRIPRTASVSYCLWFETARRANSRTWFLAIVLACPLSRLSGRHLSPALGSGRTGDGNAFDNLPGRCGTPCRAAQIPRHHARRPPSVEIRATGAGDPLEGAERAYDFSKGRRLRTTVTRSCWTG